MSLILGSTTLNCFKRRRESRNSIIIPCVTMMCLCAGLSISILPLLARNLKGPRRIFTILQQICMVLYLSILMVSQLLFKENNDFDAASKILNGEYYLFKLTKILLTLFQEFLYIYYYFLSLMQSIDVHVMICNSFKYESFSLAKNVIKMILIGALVSFVLCGDAVAIAIFSTYQLVHFYDFSMYTKFYRGIGWFLFVKICIIKICYTIAVVKIGHSVKSKLLTSLQLANRSDRAQVYQSLSIFVYIPLIVNLILIGHDVIHFILPPFTFNEANRCKPENLLDDTMAMLNLSAGFFSLASFSHIFGYLILFPKLRKAFACKSGE